MAPRFWGPGPFATHVPFPVSSFWEWTVLSGPSRRALLEQQIAQLRRNPGLCSVGAGAVGVAASDDASQSQLHASSVSASRASRSAEPTASATHPGRHQAVVPSRRRKVALPRRVVEGHEQGTAPCFPAGASLWLVNGRRQNASSHSGRIIEFLQARRVGVQVRSRAFVAGAGRGERSPFLVPAHDASWRAVKPAAAAFGSAPFSNRNSTSSP